METAVLRPQKRAHPDVREKHHTKHPEKREMPKINVKKQML